MLSTGEDRSALDMPRMCGDGCKRQSQKGFHRDLSNLQTIAILQFCIPDQALHRGMHGRRGVKAEHSLVDRARHEEKSPARLFDVSLKIGSKVGDSCPAARI